MKILSNKYLPFILVLTCGILIGWLIFRPSRQYEETHSHSEEASQEMVWTCSMHPHIRMTEPGKCPICAMDLIQLAQGGTSAADPDAIRLSREAAGLANVLTTVVTRQKPVREVRLYGKVQADERLIQSQVAHITGRIESLRVNFTGEPVSRGQVLASVYSPELVTAQQELLEAAKTKQLQPRIYEAAKEKLRQWKLSDELIVAIEASETIRQTVDVVSNTSGIVTSRLVNEGDYVSQGTPIFTVADLSRVWVLFDAYETDLQYLSKGEKISFTLRALPGKDFTANIVFVDPVIDPVTRVAKVRVEIGNQSGKLKPEMFATGVVSSDLAEYKDNIIIPRSAVLWTGKRSLVYVRQPGSDEPVFKMREIGLGPMAGTNYVVIDGLAEGEEIVTNGTFSVDAAAQLEGKPSMMNVAGGEFSEGHNHGEGQATARNSTMVHEMFEVEGLCEMCKERIESAAKSVSGVASATWDVSTKEIHIDFNSAVTSVDAIRKAIAASGHDNGSYRAPDDVYSSLAACCLYRNTEQDGK